MTFRTLEKNKVSIEDDKNNKESEHDHVMVTQTGDPNNKSKPAYKKYCSYCHKQSWYFKLLSKTT